MQAAPTSNALLFTRAPSAASGSEYQVWVVRKQRTYRIGRVTPHVDTKLECRCRSKRATSSHATFADEQSLNVAKRTSFGGKKTIDEDLDSFLRA